MDAEGSTKVLIRKSDVDGEFAARVGDFAITIERGERHVPGSVDLLLLGLGACTISTISHYMRRKDIPMENLAIELSADFNEKENFYDRMHMTLNFDERVPLETRNVIRAIAKNCRIHRTLERNPLIEIETAAPIDAATPVAAPTGSGV